VLLEDLVRQPLIVDIRLAAGVPGHLAAVDGDHVDADQPGPRAQAEDRAEHAASAA
jgi:hypothetical protein